MLLRTSGPRPPHRRVITFTRHESFEAEQFRRLRHRLEDLSMSRRVQAVAVTSAASGEGKTLVATNLAGALAQGCGARVLLLDADLRRPNVGPTCGLPPDVPGLLRVLKHGGQHLEESVCRVDGSTLDVLPCERSRVDPYELLRSAAFSDLLAHARTLYQFVVVDTAPLVPVPDSGLLERIVDGYLVVVAANTTPRRLLAETLNMLDARSVLGLVFNRDVRPLFGYYGSYDQQYFQPRQ